MEISKIKGKLSSALDKYKYAVFILVIGIALMLLPFQRTQSPEPEAFDQIDEDTVSLQEQLERVLSCVSGVGSVKVMLCEAFGEETIFQTNEDYSVSDQSESRNTECVTILDSQRNEHAVIKQINPPRYQGAIVICQGADDPVVRLSITNALSKVTGLGSDKIAVLKMK